MPLAHAQHVNVPPILNRDILRGHVRAQVALPIIAHVQQVPVEVLAVHHNQRQPHAAHPAILVQQAV